MKEEKEEKEEIALFAGGDSVRLGLIQVLRKGDRAIFVCQDDYSSVYLECDLIDFIKDVKECLLKIQQLEVKDA